VCDGGPETGLISINYQGGYFDLNQKGPVPVMITMDPFFPKQESVGSSDQLPRMEEFHHE
jgi:hypothetical protein